MKVTTDKRLIIEFLTTLRLHEFLSLVSSEFISDSDYCSFYGKFYKQRLGSPMKLSTDPYYCSIYYELYLRTNKPNTGTVIG